MDSVHLDTDSLREITEGGSSLIGSRSRCRHQAYQIPADGLAFPVEFELGPPSGAEPGRGDIIFGRNW